MSDMDNKGLNILLSLFVINWLDLLLGCVLFWFFKDKGFFNI